MSGERHLDTVVADTSALVSLAIPHTLEDYDTTERPDPLQYLLTSTRVRIPPKVRTELQELAQYEDIHGEAAKTVLTAQAHFTIDDPYEHPETPIVGQRSALMTAKPMESSSRTPECRRLPYRRVGGHELPPHSCRP